jgi:chromate transporter
VLWPAGWGGGFAWPALLIGLAAGVALFRFKLSVIRVIVGSGLAGMAWTLLR